MMEAIGRGGKGWEPTISEATVSAAVQIGRDYALPHAVAAVGLMGADGKVEAARSIWESICRQSVSSVYSVSAPPSVSRRDIHTWNRRGFPSAEHLDPAIEVLVG